ncbi:MAG TPA: YHYH domain-containing protein [Roseibacterium sp.]|nr:YHYH domain-containing protein [Roseibacterium sp.]
MPIGTAETETLSLNVDEVRHSGGANRSGCHSKTRTGGYHCH